MTMRFSTFHVPITPGPDADAAVVDALIERIFIADEGGFACIYGPEHHFDNYTTYGNNFMLMAYLAPQMKQAYVGTSLVVVPMHHPARLAEQANLLDLLSKGRFILGIGGGGIPLESAGFNLHTADQYDIHTENFDVVVDLWNKKPEDPPIEFEVRDLYKGTLYQRIMPAPHRPDGPLVKLAITSPDRIDRAARNGWAAFAGGPMALMYKKALIDCGHSPEKIDELLTWTSGTATLHVAETDAQAREEMLGQLRTRTDWVQGEYALEEATVNQWMRLKHEGFGRAPARDEDLLGRAIYGTPETVIEKLKPMADMGTREVLLMMDNGIQTPERMAEHKRCMELFTQEVVPFFDAYEPDLDHGRALVREQFESMPPPVREHMGDIDIDALAELV